jgi:hypothetical protein
MEALLELNGSLYDDSKDYLLKYMRTIKRLCIHPAIEVVRQMYQNPSTISQLDLPQKMLHARQSEVINKLLFATPSNSNKRSILEATGQTTNESIERSATPGLILVHKDKVFKPKYIFSKCDSNNQYIDLVEQLGKHEVIKRAYLVMPPKKNNVINIKEIPYLIPIEFKNNVSEHKWLDRNNGYIYRIFYPDIRVIDIVNGWNIYRDNIMPASRPEKISWVRSGEFTGANGQQYMLLKGIDKSSTLFNCTAINDEQSHLLWCCMFRPKIDTQLTLFGAPGENEVELSSFCKHPRLFNDEGKGIGTTVFNHIAQLYKEAGKYIYINK